MNVSVLNPWSLYLWAAENLVLDFFPSLFTSLPSVIWPRIVTLNSIFKYSSHLHFLSLGLSPKSWTPAAYWRSPRCLRFCNWMPGPLLKTSSACSLSLFNWWQLQISLCLTPKNLESFLTPHSLYLTYTPHPVVWNPCSLSLQACSHPDHLSPPPSLPSRVHCHHLLSGLLQQPPNNPLPISALQLAVLNTEIRRFVRRIHYSSTQSLPVFSVSLRSKSQSPSLAYQGPLISSLDAPSPSFLLTPTHLFLLNTLILKPTKHDPVLRPLS